MRIIFLLIFIIPLFPNFVCAQSSLNLDSLVKDLQKYPKADSVRIYKLLTLGKATPATDSNRIAYYEEALSIALDIQDSLAQVRAYHLAFLSYKSKGVYPKAFDYGTKALALYKARKDNVQIANIYNELSSIYLVQLKYDKAYEMVEEAYQLLKDESITPQYLRVMNNLVNLGPMKKKDYATARQLLKETLANAKTINSTENIIHTYAMLINVFLEDPKADKTEELLCDRYADSISSIYPALPFSSPKRYTAAFILSYYYDVTKQDSTLALKYGQLALSSAKQLGKKRSISGAYRNLFETYKSYGEYDKAILMLDSAFMIKDEIFKDKNSAKLQELETRFKTEKAVQDKELAEQKVKLAKAETRSYRNSLIALSIGIFFLLISILFYVWQYRLRKQKELVTKELDATQKRLEVEQQFRKAELKALKAQLNPHFMFNALNSIQDYILLNEKELASDYLGKFADLMRIYLNHSQEGNLSLEEEIEALELYLDLEAVRFDNSIDYTITIDEELDTEALKIPTMLVQPYVENAVKHGLFYKKEGERQIHIYFNEHNDEYIEAIIKDNGIGRAASAKINAHRNPNHKSFATAANATRLDLLNHGRHQKIEVKYIDLYQNEKVAGTEVRILIPLKQTA